MNKSDAEVHIELIAYSITQAAIALGIDKERMGGLVRAGTVPHTRLGSRVLIGKRALEQWLTESCAANARVERLAQLGRSEDVGSKGSPRDKGRSVASA